ncbi:MAG TPA: hypothetical protein VFV86_12825, partial [Nitrososphaeraceae archaeon]|nr:hypothetical protein [Nitrososphaeraceae archaeon]
MLIQHKELKTRPEGHACIYVQLRTYFGLKRLTYKENEFSMLIFHLDNIGYGYILFLVYSSYS